MRVYPCGEDVSRKGKGSGFQDAGVTYTRCYCTRFRMVNGKRVRGGGYIGTVDIGKEKEYGEVLVLDTGRKCGGKKRKTSEGWKDEQGRDKQGVRREEGENVDWPQIESHPFITPGLVRSATLPPSPPPCPQDRRHRGQKSGTSPPRAHLSAEDSLAEAVVTVESRKSDSWNGGPSFLWEGGAIHTACRGLYVDRNRIGRGARLGKWTSFLAPRAEFYGRCKIN